MFSLEPVVGHWPQAPREPQVSARRARDTSADLLVTKMKD
jgi:hypothetical protein